jgi:hypothetical protein
MERRVFLKSMGGVGLLALAPPVRLQTLLAEATSAPAGAPGRFLTAHELHTLRALTARLVPGPPEDPDPGALEAGAAEAIDLFLGAFCVDPPLIHAGGPFSDRAGSGHDDMANFVPLDPLAELGWRIRLEGSQGRPEREFAGPVTGLQEVYRQGLAHLDAISPAGVPFARLPPAGQDQVLADTADQPLQDFVNQAMSDTLDAVYGAPEYGGNRDLVGWAPNDWPGDVQPRGYTDAQVTRADPPAVTTVASSTEAQALLDHTVAAATRPAVRRALPGLKRGAGR